MPDVLGNNYLHRLKNVRNLHSDEGLLDYKLQWPAFLPLYDVSPVIHSCPIGLHMIVWGSKGPIKARLYDRLSASSYLGPLLSNEVPHYVHYGENGFDATKKVPSDCFSETTLGEGEYLFVPATMLVSFDCDTATENNVLLRSCFADASNLKEFRSLLAVEAKISFGSREWLTEIDRLSFDYSLSRSPPELPLISAESGATAEVTRDVEQKPAGKRRNRGGGMRGMYASLFMSIQLPVTVADYFNHTDVSDLALWNNLVTTLTLPTPSIPRFVDVGLNSAVLEWDSGFSPSSLDKTAFGFTLNVCEASDRDSCYEHTFDSTELVTYVSKVDPEISVFKTTVKKYLKPSKEYIAR